MSHVYLPTYGFQPLSLVTLPGTTEKSLLSGYWKYSITLPWHFNQIAPSHLLSQFHKLFITHNPGSFLTFHFFYILSDLEARKEALSSQSSESCQILRCNTAWHYRFSYTSFLLWLVREGFTSSPAPPAIIDWTAGLQQALTSKERLITWDCRFFHMLSLIYTGFKQCFKCSACITKISSDFNCKFPFPFKTRKHRITISYSQLILHQSLQKSHSGESHRSATWLWEHTSPSHASQRAQGTEEWEESTPYSTRTARTGRQVRQRVKRCGGLAWRPRWCIPRHLENFSTKRFGGSLELGHHLPEHDRRNTLVGEAHWRYWVTHSGWTLAKQGHTKRNSLLRA